jgi:hypothetical protein
LLLRPVDYTEGDADTTLEATLPDQCPHFILDRKGSIRLVNLAKNLSDAAPATCQNDPDQMTAATSDRSTPTESISGLIERVTFFNEESGFCVLRLKAPGHRDEVTVIGSLPSVSSGEWLAAEGWWVNDSGKRRR